MKIKRILLQSLILLTVFTSCMQEEEPYVPVESIKITEENLEINIEQNAVVPIELIPEKSSFDIEKLKFEITPKDLCNISNIDKSGCILTGLKSGNGVLTVSYENMKDYMQVEVKESVVSKYTYISLAEPDLKIQSGTRRTVVANLVGADKENINDFKWESSDKSVVSIEYSGSSAILTANKYGSAVVTVSNTSCLYPAKMLVIVPEKEGNYCYLTTEDNVINVVQGENADFSVSLIGGNEEDYSQITYRIKEGEDLFTISGSGGKCSISAKEEGQGLIEIIHSKVTIPLTIQVNITTSAVNDNIICDTDFLYFENKDKKEINLSLYSGLNGSWTFEKNDDGVIDVILYNNKLVIVPLKSGESIIKVSNTLIKDSKEIKVIVDNIFLKKEKCSIRTSQNVIKMTEGESDIPLEIELLGGNENDKSGFIWTVSDSSVIKLDCVDGKAVYSRNAANINEEEKTSGLAYISAISCGHASIEISHPKSEYNCTVDIIVYPKGSLNNNYIEVTGKTLAEISCNNEILYSFNENVDYSSFTYSVSEDNIIEVFQESNGFKIKGNQTGNVLLTFYSNILKTPFSVNVICKDENNAENKKYFSADVSNIKGYKEKVYYFSLVGDFSEGIGNVLLSLEDKDICSVSNIQEIICIEFKKTGSTILKINVEGFDNEILIPLYCTEKENSLKYPYEIYCDSFAALNCEKEISIPLSLSGSNEEENNSLNFDYDEQLVNISYDGKNLILKGLKEGRGVIKVSHPKVFEDKEISYVTYKTYSESLKKLSIWTEKNSFIGNKNEKILVKINSSDNLEHEYTCTVSDINIVDCTIDNNYLLINLKEYGKTCVYVQTQGAYDICLNVNVVSEEVTEPDSYFNIPVIVRGVVESTFEIKADYSDEYKNYISNINWIYPEEFKIAKNHASASFTSKKEGVFEVYAEIQQLGIKKKTLVYIYKSSEDLDNSNTIYLDKFAYNLIEGEGIELNAKLIADWKKEEIISKINWEITEGNSNIEIKQNGLKCNIKALKEGFSRIKVFNNDFNLSFEFIVYISKKENDSFYNFRMERMICVKPSEIKTVNYVLENIINNKDYNNVTVKCDNSFIDLKVNGNEISIFALKEGDYYCTLQKKGWNDFTFLVCCRQDDVTEVNYLFSSETVKLIKTGASSPLYFYSNDNKSIRYSISGDDCIEIDNKTDYVIVKGLKEGECTLSAEYEEKTFDVKIIVKYEDDILQAELKVPQFVYLKKGSSIDLNIWCDTTVFFESMDLNLSIISNGNNVNLCSEFAGIYELKVSVTENYYKIIKVVVYENEEELENIFIINIPLRFYEIRKGKSISINTLITGNDYENISFSQSSDDFADLNYQNGIFTIDAKEEGTFTVKFKYHEDYISIMINIKGYNEYICNEDEYNSINYYLTADKTSSFIKMNDTQTFSVNLTSLNGEYYSYNNDYIWTVKDNSIISIITSDNICSVKGLKKGKTQLYCSSVNAVNTVIINIEVGSDYDYFEANNHFIHVNNTVVYHDMNEEFTTFEGTAYNIAKEDLNNLYVNVENTDTLSVNYVINENKILFTVRGKKCGKTIITIGTPNCDFVTKVTVIISHTIKSESVYLTTSQNYSILKVGETLSLGVILKNHEELNAYNYNWKKMSGSECLTVIGNGKDIQVYGLKEGMCRLRCEHIPSGSYIDLYVLVSNTEKTIKYLTCDSLVIDTTVSSSMNSFMCNIIGGEEKDNSKYKFTVDNPDVISVVSSGNIFYYRGLKEGTANIHITNESGCVNSLDIVFVVKNTVTNTYMKPDVSSVYLKKNTAGTSVSVSFENCTSSIDNNLIDWFIYSQSINTDNVISIVSSGNKCVIKPENNGYAMIRANYEPLGLSCTIGVYVDNVGKISFLDKSIKVAEGESIFAELVLPDYLTDIADYITFKSLDESKCKAFGTGKVCCIEAIEEGSCIVRAYNSIDESYCDLGVNIIEEKTEEPKLILSKNTIVLNPRSENPLLYAYLSGAELNGFEGDDIQWKIKSDSTGCLSLYPSTGEQVYLRLNPCNDINDSDYGKVKCGQAIIEVSHNLSSISKTIYVSIQEQSNYFSLDNYSVKLEVSSSKEIKCKILNGKLKDYDNVKWSVSGSNTDKYGNKVSIVKLLNTTGESCSIYGLNEGICTLSAFYFGTIVTCEIEVTSARTFKISGSTSVQMIPDVTDDNYLDIQYVLRPSNTVPIWSVQNINTTENNNLISVEVIEGKSCIRIRPLGSEGQAKILGTAVGVGQVSINVNVKFNPKLELMEDDVYSVRIEMDDLDETKNIVKYKFSSYPSIYYVKPSISGINADSFKAFVESTQIVNGRMEGTIVIQALKESPDNSALITLQQYSDSLFENKIDRKDSKIEIYAGARYPSHKIMLGFRRGAGGFSFRNNLNELHQVNENFVETNSGKYFKLWETGENAPVLSMADGEQHYFVIKDMNKHSFTEIKKVEIIKKDSPEIVESKIDGLLSPEYLEQYKNYIKNNLYKVCPISIENQEKTEEGSYVFDIITGEKDNGKITKYGRDWFALGKSPYPCSVFGSKYVEFYEPEIKIDDKIISLPERGNTENLFKNSATYFTSNNINYIYDWKGPSFSYDDFNLNPKIKNITNIEKQTNIMSTRNSYRNGGFLGDRYTRFLRLSELKELGNECAGLELQTSYDTNCFVKSLYKSDTLKETRYIIFREPDDVKGEKHADVSWAEDAINDERGALRNAELGSLTLSAYKDVPNGTVIGTPSGVYYEWGNPPYHSEYIQQTYDGEDYVSCTFSKTKYTYNLTDNDSNKKSFYLLEYEFGGKKYCRLISFNEKNKEEFNSSETYCLRFLPINGSVYYMGSLETMEKTLEYQTLVLGDFSYYGPSMVWEKVTGTMNCIHFHTQVKFDVYLDHKKEDDIPGPDEGYPEKFPVNANTPITLNYPNLNGVNWTLDNFYNDGTYDIYKTNNFTQPGSTSIDNLGLFAIPNHNINSTQIITTYSKLTSADLSILKNGQSYLEEKRFKYLTENNQNLNKGFKYFYDQKTDYDFKIYYGDIKITYTDITGTDKTILFPLYISYYNNDADYYDYSSPTVNYVNSKYNTRKEITGFFGKKYTITNPKN